MKRLLASGYERSNRPSIPRVKRFENIQSHFGERHQVIPRRAAAPLGGP